MRVLVTRPEDDARRLVALLADRGIEVVSAPLLHIDLLTGDDLDLNGVQALLFTSANGVRSFGTRSGERDIPALCVGDATAREARDAGFTDVRSAGGDVDDVVSRCEDTDVPQLGKGVDDRPVEDDLVRENHRCTT